MGKKFLKYFACFSLLVLTLPTITSLHCAYEDHHKVVCQDDIQDEHFHSVESDCEMSDLLMSKEFQVTYFKSNQNLILSNQNDLFSLIKTNHLTNYNHFSLRAPPHFDSTT